MSKTNWGKGISNSCCKLINNKKKNQHFNVKKNKGYR